MYCIVLLYRVRHQEHIKLANKRIIKQLYRKRVFWTALCIYGIYIKYTKRYHAGFVEWNEFSRYRTRVHLSQIQHVSEDYDAISFDTRAVVYNSETIYELDRNRASYETIYLHISLFGICFRHWAMNEVSRTKTRGNMWTIKNRYCRRSNSI